MFCLYLILILISRHLYLYSQVNLYSNACAVTEKTSNSPSIFTKITKCFSRSILPLSKCGTRTTSGTQVPSSGKERKDWNKNKMNVKDKTYSYRAWSYEYSLLKRLSQRVQSIFYLSCFFFYSSNTIHFLWSIVAFNFQVSSICIQRLKALYFSWAYNFYVILGVKKKLRTTVLVNPKRVFHSSSCIDFAL